ncbi:MAG: hydantoinase/oxoprolinase family protein [Rhodospirillales bacterium]|nr:hydantoinase/oxoprolinase family protein [Rhodospirillales bacterium]
MASARLAVDIGGTFTDLALEHDGRRTTLKVLTTPAAPEEGVLTGVRAILDQASLAPTAIGLMIHGTTLATNAIIERKGARTALITTAGFRDVLAMRNESRYDQYDLNLVLPEPLVPRYLRLPVPERIDNRGEVLTPLDEAAVRALLPVLARERVESLAVGFLHSFVNPGHEARVRAIVAEARPDLPVSLSSEVSPEMREWERFSTTVANAYVQPTIARYLRRLEFELRALGLTASLFLMLSGGGLTTVETACRFPIRLVESGPAGGAIFAARIARAKELPRVLSFDMGGTTAKICLIDDFRPQTAKSFEVARVGRFRKGSGLPLSIPVIEMVEIGAGGGSLARVDALGRIAVGPESAGADPGPACYGRGGLAPAVTDANLLLGRYDPERFAGSKLPLDRAAATAALERAIARPLGLSPEMAALGIIAIVDETMANAARVHAIESGKTYAGRTLIAFGGGGPVHACRLAEKLGIRRVLVPSGAGVGSAIGFLEAPVAYELVRSLYQRLSAFDVRAVNTLLEAMAAEAIALVGAASPGTPTIETRTAFMRYVGQGHEIPVPLPPRRLECDEIATIRAAYDAAYARFYDRPVPGSDVEVLSFSVIVSTESRTGPPTPQTPAAATGSSPVQSQAALTQRVRDDATGEVADWAVFPRAALRPGQRITGPAIISEDETSTLLARGWSAVCDGLGYLVLDKDTPDV